MLLRSPVSGFSRILDRTALPSMRMLKDSDLEGKLKSAQMTVPKDLELTSPQVLQLLSTLGTSFGIYMEIGENDRGGGVFTRLLYEDGRIQTLTFWNPPPGPSPTPVAPIALPLRGSDAEGILPRPDGLRVPGP
jgi:hypothetical protein